MDIQHAFEPKKMNRSSKPVELFWSSPNRYEKLTLEIQLDRQPIAEINCERGPENLEVELFGSLPDKKHVVKLPVDDLINALIEARDALKAFAESQEQK